MADPEIFWTSEMKASVVGAGIGFGAAALLWILAELTKLIDRRWNKPSVDARFELAEDCVVHTRVHREQYGIGDARYTKETYVRLRIQNTGNVGINNCQAWLVGIDRYVGNLYKESEYKEALPLIWSYMPELETMHIPPGVTTHADILIFRTKSTPTPQLRSPMGEVLQLRLYERLFDEQGRFRYRLVVSGDGMIPVPAEVEYAYSEEKSILYQRSATLEIVKPTREDWVRENPKQAEREAKEKERRDRKMAEAMQGAMIEAKKLFGDQAVPMAPGLFPEGTPPSPPESKDES